MSKDDRIQEHASRVVKIWRVRRDMSQSALAEKIGVHQTTIAKIENNERRIDFSAIVKIAHVLGIPWDEFNVNTPSDLDVLIQALERFHSACDLWFVTTSELKSVRDTHQKALEDLITAVGPARLPKAEYITAESLNECIASASSLSRYIIESTPHWDQAAMSGALAHLDTIHEFTDQLEKLDREQSSATS